MPRESALAYWFRAALSGAVGALVFVLPSVHGPAPTRVPTAFAGDHATEVMPPASTHIAPSTGLFATACTGAGKCVAGGDYQDGSKPVVPAVARESHGRWSRGTTLSLPSNAARQPYSEVNGIACVSAGNCVAVGDYEYGRTNSLQAFIATESHGVWGRAFTPRLPSNSSAPASAQLGAVACTHSGFCEAVGSYQDSSGNDQMMALAKPAGGGWRQATEVASPASAATNPDAFVTGIACTGPGSCVAVGNYSVSSNRFAAMGAIESRGSWHRASGIAAPRGAIPSTFTAISSISCPPAGPCLGVGEYAVSATQSRAMSVTEAKGRFSAAMEITAVPPGASLHPSTYLLGVSCGSPGTCLAVGGGRTRAGLSVGMYMIRSHGRWRAAFLPPPPRASSGDRGLSALYSVSCTGRDRCTAVGYFHDRTGHLHAEAASTR
jgi:hypothetical protein